jgi:putative membrane protein
MNDRIALPIIGTLSVLIPIAVAVLIYVPIIKVNAGGFDVNLLPFVNACINSTVSILLVLGYYFIRKKQISYHKTCMISAFVLSSIFLITYILYHALKSASGAGHTVYGGTGLMKPIYYFILISHILLATVIVPLALLSIYRGLNSQFSLHRKIAKWTLPIWLYVSITGVLVYLMISPYYV